jgi:DNA repair exonuclease SbcCD ATPase subunit
VVQKIQREAEGEFRQREQELVQKLQTAEEKLARLQSQDSEGEFILTDEQKSEIQAFREEQIKTRKDLRSVQHDLQSNIDKLRSTVTFLNTAMVPILLSLLVAFTSYRRARKRRVR